jgi:RNA polymerase sigma-70 factor (ECF subfamily)
LTLKSHDRPFIRLAARASAPVRPAVDDGALLAAVRAGDPQVAATLCERVFPQVDRTIHRLLGRNDVDRDDVAQIALMELVRDIGRFKGECPLDAWVNAITAHVVWKHIRRRRIERRIFAELLSDDELGGAFGSDDGQTPPASRELVHRVAAHLHHMKLDQAWAFVLHDVLGYDLREIADMTRASTAAAQSRLSRGRRELHERIARDPELVSLMHRAEGRA